MLRRPGLRQAVRALHYGLIVLTAWAAAAVVVRIPSLDLHPRIAQLPPAPETAEKAPKGKRASDDAVILKRNLFGATDLDVGGDEAPAAAAAADLRLRGIATAKGTSFAVFENTASGEQNVFGVGDRIFDGPKLVAVDPAGADVLLKGRKKRYEIKEDDDGSASGSERKGGHGGARHGSEKADKSAKGAKATKTAKSAKTAKGDTGGVRKTGESAYLVDRREVESTVANLNEVITEARAVPVLTDGKSNGFKLFNIRPGSIFSKIGLVDGDIVQRVNDTELTDPSKAVGLLEEIQSMSQIRVNFVRSGKLHTYTYTIR